ncbi:putative sugar transport protein [Klebsiella michiganensis]|nr:putative sugar transport protein [Klebsiella michiganensis]
MNVFATRPEWKAFLLALAGSVVLIVGMGYGRFAYTGILPLMLNEQLLTLREGNLAASANYAGYLAGALLLAKARPADARWLSLLSRTVDAGVPGLTGVPGFPLGDYCGARNCRITQRGDADRRLSLATAAYEAP